MLMDTLDTIKEHYTGRVVWIENPSISLPKMDEFY